MTLILTAILTNLKRNGKLRDITARPQSRSLESQTAGLQSLWLARRLKPWLVTTDGLSINQSILYYAEAA